MTNTSLIYKAAPQTKTNPFTVNRDWNDECLWIIRDIKGEEVATSHAYRHAMRIADALNEVWGR